MSNKFMEYNYLEKFPFLLRTSAMQSENAYNIRKNNLLIVYKYSIAITWILQSTYIDIRNHYLLMHTLLLPCHSIPMMPQYFINTTIYTNFLQRLSISFLCYILTLIIIISIFIFQFHLEHRHLSSSSIYHAFIIIHYIIYDMLHILTLYRRYKCEYNQNACKES